MAKSDLRISQNDLIVAYNTYKKKNVLAYVDSIDGSDINCSVADETLAYKSTTEIFTVPFSLVRTVLGVDAPLYGKIYGVPVHAFNNLTHVKGWGDLLWMYPNSDESVSEAETVITDLVAFTRQNKLSPFVFTTHMHQHDPSDKHLGWYYYFPKRESDKIIYNVDDDRHITPHIAAHEYGHGLWNRIMINKERADWVTLFHDFVEVDVSHGNMISTVLQDFKHLSGAKSLGNLYKDYRKENLKDHIAIANTVIRMIKDEHCLDKLDITCLLADGRPLDKILPSLTTLKKGVANTGVSKYANKAARELWCEAFAAYYAEEDLPDEFEKAIESTLITLKASRD